MATVLLNECTRGQTDIPKSMIAVADAVQVFLSTLETEASARGLKYLKSCFDEPVCPPIDYERYAVHFTYGYFLQNYWKTCLTFLSHPPRVATHVLDAGSGSGASTLAYLAYLDNIIDHPLQIDLTLVDRSNAQLNLAKKIIGLSAIHLRRLKLQCRCRRLDIRSLNLDIYPELILQGHVLTENVPDVRSILSRMTAAVSEDGQIYVIERSHDLVWRSIHSCISSLAFPATFNTVESADRITKVASEHLSNISLSTRFLVLRSPERKLLVKLIQKYFAAWQEQSPELLDQVFTPDAQYHEKPGEPPLQGIYAIKEYWKCKVVSQRNININVKHYSYTADDVTAEWFVTFDREADRQYDIRGMLILKLDPRRGLISSLREYFTTSKT